MSIIFALRCVHIVMLKVLLGFTCRFASFSEQAHMLLLQYKVMLLRSFASIFFLSTLQKALEEAASQ